MFLKVNERYTKHDSHREIASKRAKKKYLPVFDILISPLA